MMALFNSNYRACWCRRLILVVLCSLGVYGFVPVSKFNHKCKLEANFHSKVRQLPTVFFSSFNNNDQDEEDDDEDDEIDLSDQDWRAFRAKLVMQKPEAAAAAEETSGIQDDDGDLDGIGSLFASSTISTTTTTTKDSPASSSSSFTPLDPSQWAYDSGNVIEKGAVILGGVEQDFGFGLRQQYFHKAAILVLDHDENTFTKGIILNRPTDLMLDDDVNKCKWRVWFGGDVQGLTSSMPEIVCLHSIKNKTVTDASIPVMKDIQVSNSMIMIVDRDDCTVVESVMLLVNATSSFPSISQWTSFDNAKKLVKKGVASPSDFWVFAGYGTFLFRA